MTANFADGAALVTGAASGIGAAVVHHLARKGVGEFILVDKDEAGLAALDVAATLHRHSGNVADETLWDAIDGAGYPIRHAVIAAGIAHAAMVADHALDDWRRVMAVNLDGAFLALRSALRAMATGGEGGAIVTVASATGFKPEPGVAAYGASKAALMHLTRVAAKENAARNIRVNAIAPGGVDTPIWDGVPVFDNLVAQLGSRDAAIAKMGEMATPLGRYAGSDEIAAQIAFLLSADAATITGTVLTSDGGYTL